MKDKQNYEMKNESEHVFRIGVLNEDAYVVAMNGFEVIRGPEELGGRYITMAVPQSKMREFADLQGGSISGMFSVLQGQLGYMHKGMVSDRIAKHALERSQQLELENLIKTQDRTDEILYTEGMLIKELARLDPTIQDSLGYAGSPSTMVDKDDYIREPVNRITARGITGRK